MKNFLSNRWPLVILTLAASMLFAFSFAKKYDLSFKLAKGKTYVYATTASQVISQEANGQKMDFNQAFGFDYLLEVQTQDKQQNSTINFVYDRIKVKMANPMMSVDYDSSSPTADTTNPMTKIFASMKGLSFLVTVAPKGTITSVQGVEKLIDAMATSIAGNDTAKLASLKENLASQFGETSQKSSLEAITHIYPPNQVAIGETWTIVTEQKSIFPVKSENTYRLVSVNKDVANVSLMAKVNGSGTVNGGDLSLSGDQTGEMQISLKTGLVITSSLVQRMSGTINIQGMSLPMKLTTTSTVAGKER